MFSAYNLSTNYEQAIWTFGTMRHALNILLSDQKQLKRRSV